MKRGNVSKYDIEGKSVLERKMVNLHQVLVLNRERCIGCGVCSATCPQDAAKLCSSTIKDGRLVKKIAANFDASKCNFCGECVVLCPANAIKIEVNGKESIPAVEANAFPTLIKNIEVDQKKCNISCKLVCKDNCATKAIEVMLNRTNNGGIRGIQDVKVDTGLCIFCGKCEIACSQGAIRVAKPFYGTLDFDTDLCPLNCQVCVDACPSKAISLNPNGQPKVDEQICVYCGACQETCPKKAISLKRTQVFYKGDTSGAWLKALEKLSSRPHVVKDLNSRTRKKLVEVTRNRQF